MELILALSCLKKQQTGPAFIKRHLSILQQYAINGNQSFQLLTSFLADVGKEVDEKALTVAIKTAKAIQKDCLAYNIKYLTVVDSQYPQSLLEIGTPPPVLYYRGNIQLLESPIAGIIGSRNATPNGMAIAERIGSYLTEKGFIICNGLARGIDESAVKSESVKSNTIGVLPGGLAFDQHQTLNKHGIEIAAEVFNADGLLVSELAPTDHEDQFSVTRSCRIQAGLSSVLILVQSAVDGGSRYTIKPFCTLPRPLGIIYPIQADYSKDGFAANRLIIEKGVEGVKEFVGSKRKSIPNKLIIIRGKQDYESLTQISQKGNETLF